MEIHARHVGDVGRPVLLSFPEGVNLAGAVVRLQVVDATGTVLLNAPCEITSPSDPATVRYEPAADELDQVGVHRMTAEVAYAGGEVETFPTPGYAWMLVESQVA